jgi:hypothetical protein
VNALGTIQDAKARDSSWNGKIMVKTRVYKDKWTVETKIPFSELGLKKGSINKVWSVNVSRSAKDPDNPLLFEDTAWSPTGSSSIHIPEKMGYIWLEAGSEFTW